MNLAKVFLRSYLNDLVEDDAIPRINTEIFQLKDSATYLRSAFHFGCLNLLRRRRIGTRLVRAVDRLVLDLAAGRNGNVGGVYVL